MVHRNYKLVSIIMKQNGTLVVKVYHCGTESHLQYSSSLTSWHHSPQHHEIRISSLPYIFRAWISFWVYSLENMANLSLLNNNMIFKGVIMSEFITWFWFSFPFLFYFGRNRIYFLGCAFKIIFLFTKGYIIFALCVSQLGTQKYEKDEKRTMNSLHKTLCDMWMKW